MAKQGGLGAGAFIAIPLILVGTLIAGILEMPYWMFQFANFTSAFVWAYVLLFFGDFSFNIFKLF